MTKLPSLPLTEGEKDLLMGLVEGMVNEGSYHPRLYKQFHRFIQKLQMKYGEIAHLMALKADFLDANDSIEKIELYKKAIQLAGNPLDIAVITQSMGSIAELYIEELSDQVNGFLWLVRYKETISKYGDEYIVVNPVELEPVLKRLSIHVVG